MAALNGRDSAPPSTDAASARFGGAGAGAETAAGTGGGTGGGAGNGTCTTGDGKGGGGVGGEAAASCTSTGGGDAGPGGGAAGTGRASGVFAAAGSSTSTTTRLPSRMVRSRVPGASVIMAKPAPTVTLRTLRVLPCGAVTGPPDGNHKMAVLSRCSSVKWGGAVKSNTTRS